MDLIESGKPVWNVFGESANGEFYRERLNKRWFSNLEEARMTLEDFRADDNGFRSQEAVL